MTSTTQQDADFASALKAQQFFKDWVIQQGTVPPPPLPGSPVVSSGSFTLTGPATVDQFVGTLTATNSPTSWSLSGDTNKNFAVYAQSGGGAVNLRTSDGTSAGGGGGPTPPAGVYHLTLNATNAAGIGHAAVTVTVSAVVQGTGSLPTDDGFANAPHGTIQLPTLLSGYSHRPPWKVAGVDYAVGPRLPTLKDPATASGVGIHVSGQTVSLTSGATFVGYDCSLRGGYQVNIGGDNITVTDCKFAYTTPGAHAIDGGGANCVLRYNDFDCSGYTNGSIGINAPIFWRRGTSLTVEYNRFYKFIQHLIESVFPNSGVPAFTYVFRFNLIHNGGTGASQGGHTNWLQWGGIPPGSRAIVQCNMSACLINGNNEGYQTYPNNPGSAGAQSTADIGWNTCVAPSSNAGPSGFTALNYMFHPSRSADVTGFAANFHDNYADMSGGFGMFYGKFTPNTYTANVNMLNGAPY